MMSFKALFKLLDQKCIFCGDVCKDFNTSPSCQRCFEELKIWGESCIKCGKKMPSSGICGECLNEKSPFDFLYHIYHYEGKAKELINFYKFKGAWYLANLFSLKILKIIKELPENFRNAPLTFVPAHPYRIFTRNYQPVEYLTKVLCKNYNKTFLTALKKVQMKKPQTSLPKEKREKNVKGTFKTRNILLPEYLILLDDIYTTGSTLKECAKTLKKSGVKGIAGITLARV